MKDHSLLIVDDEAIVRETLASILAEEGYRVSEAGDGQEALDLLDEHGGDAFDFILCDIKMPRVDGLEFLRKARARGCAATIVMMSAYGTVDTALEALKLGAYDYISKPFKTDEVLLTLRKAEERERLIRENRALREAIRREYQFENLVARSARMRAVLELLAKVADYRTSVLLVGEAGTGKEMLARALHYNSRRSDGPLLKVNCRAMADAVLESELFGHEPGAVSDAPRARAGLFEQAQGGTVFLEDVDGLPAFLQVRLLRVLQEGVVRRAGGTADLPVDVRVVSSCRVDLKKAVSEGSFREDLYYRLSVIPVLVPPLRERREDIPLLVNRFLDRFARETGKSVTGVSAEGMEMLLRYRWPGNVRELESVIERAVVMAEGPVIDEAHLSPWIQDDQEGVFPGIGPDEYSIKKVVARVEEELIRRALRKTRGNRSRASRLLEISHRTLLYKIKDYEIDL
ncbi:sigma-54-dependent transcriptional regulator [Deferrisoma camini]|uniref:sigma-54-dependent transcriptional regulator n=1 Tax=Deferrisoma camini TaxID=1035120 RepID=UPI00046CCDD5|nr:sigma-54 dependent transcriptional regulator [Deferrisoma camini]